MTDRNNLAYWFPRLQATCVPVPRTEIVHTDVNFSPLFDGKEPDGFAAFLLQMRATADRIGYPIFLRTGHGSDKHGWKRSCFVERAEDLGQHIFNLVEWSECVDLLGLPTGTWAVREFLKLEHSFTAFNGMPVARENRFFIEDGDFICQHPYWPPEVLEEHFKKVSEFGRKPPVNWRHDLDMMNGFRTGEVDLLVGMARQVSAGFDGAWSVDFACKTDGSWVAIDMAEAAVSWHRPGCPNAKRWPR